MAPQFLSEDTFARLYRLSVNSAPRVPLPTSIG